MKLKKKTKRGLLVLGVLLLLMAGISYYLVFRNNVKLSSGLEKEYLFIPNGSGFEEVVSLLHSKNFLKDEMSFTLLSKIVGYPEKIYPGRYRLKNGMSNLDLLKQLKSGKQEPVKVVINGSQSMQNFMEYISNNLAITFDELNLKLSDDDYLNQYELKKETAPCLIIPNTYEMYWNISADKFLEKMHQAYLKFWNDKRIQKCKDAGLTKSEAVILASIIERESNKEDELPVIAGVYINRLAKGMKLQADPTVKFAMNNMEAKRIYKNMLDFDSPYNTYKYSGLPPGPIGIPAIASVDAVLNYQKHNFLYFCARPDASGYSNFTETYKEHQINAKNYQSYLDRIGTR